MQSAAVIAKIECRHIGVARLQKLLMAPVNVAKLLIQSGILGIHIDDPPHGIDGVSCVTLRFNHRHFGQPRKLAIYAFRGNACQIGDRRIILTEIGHLLGHEQSCELIVGVDEKAEPQTRRNRLTCFIVTLIKCHRDDRIGDHLVRVGHGAGLTCHCRAYQLAIELSRQPGIDDFLNSLHVSTSRVECSKLQHQMRPAQPSFQPDDALLCLGYQPQMFGHQSGVKSKIGWYASILVDGESSGFEKGRNTGVTLAQGN